MVIKLLTLEEVLDMHQDQISRYGGIHGIRDINLLESAVFTPQASFNNNYLHPDIFHMAAAYMHSITQNHPFLDGNKRTGLISALIFLRFHGYKLHKSDTLYEISMATARGETSVESLSEFFKKHSISSY